MTQHSKFSEAALETAIIELLGQGGYPDVKGDTITRKPGQILLHADLRALLATGNRSGYQPARSLLRRRSIRAQQGDNEAGLRRIFSDTRLR